MELFPLLGCVASQLAAMAWARTWNYGFIAFHLSTAFGQAIDFRIERRKAIRKWRDNE